MADDLVTALEITVVGMALVFGGIVLLWALMVGLVRLTARYEELEAAAARQRMAQTADEIELKRRAAVVAVAVALARAAEPQPHEFPLPPTAIVSAWQSVMRGRQLKQKGPIR